jgi:hypothetical protein
MQIPLRYSRMGTPFDGGGFSEVWKSEYEGRVVAIKVLKVYQTSDINKITRVCCLCNY